MKDDLNMIIDEQHRLPIATWWQDLGMLPEASLPVTDDLHAPEFDLTPASLAPAPDQLEVAPGNYAPFFSSPLWAQQRDYFATKGPEAWRRGEVPHYITSNPVLAESYAKIIVRYVLDGLHDQTIDPREPLYVLEPGAGCGRFSYLLLRQLTFQQRACRLEDLKLILLISDFPPANRQFLSEHPYLQAYLKDGRARVIPFDVEKDAHLRVDPNHAPLTTTVNPLIVLANYLLDGLPQHLFYLHYRQWWEGEVTLLKKERSDTAAVSSPQNGSGAFDDLHLGYRWQPRGGAGECSQRIIQEKPELTHQALEELLTGYEKTISSAPILFPSTALAFLQRMITLSQNRLLWLSTDWGVSCPRQLRQRSLPQLTSHGSFSLPVNYHALEHFLRQKGAWVHQVQHRNHGLVVQAAITAPQRSADAFSPQTIKDQLSEYNPDDFFVIKRSLHRYPERLSSDQMLSFLRLSRYDYKVLKLFLPTLLKRGVPMEDHQGWGRALREVWANYFPLGENDDFAFRLGVLAMDLSQWRLARMAFMICWKWHGQRPVIYYNLGLEAYLCGRLALAKKYLGKALKLDTQSTQAQNLSAEITQWQDDCARLEWYFPDQAHQGKLRVEPLGIKHAPDLLIQYRDPQIAAYSRLPWLDSFAQTRAFIEDSQRQQDRATFAVLHQDFGFVGLVSYQWAKESGYFYFWIGVDYQGQGLGPRAAKLAGAQARALGLTRLFTSCWEHNQASMVALKKAGFIPLAGYSESQGYREQFYRLALTDGATQVSELDALRQLLKDMNSSTEIMDPLEAEKAIAHYGPGFR